MGECLGSYFFHNNQLLPSRDKKLNFFEEYLNVYEVIRVIDGIYIFLEDHIERLNHSISLAGGKYDLRSELLQKQLQWLQIANQILIGNVRLDLFFKQNKVDLTAYFIHHFYPDTEQYSQGVEVVLYPFRRSNPNAKILDSDLHKEITWKLKETGAWEAILVNEEGFITEGSKSNLFIICGDQVITPPENDVLKGITRKYIMEICREEYLSLMEQKINVSQLQYCDAFFITGTSAKVLPVKQIGEILFDTNNILMRKIMNRYDHKIIEYIENFQCNPSRIIL
jgi:branched-chain amino acid aminotransferase